MIGQLTKKIEHGASIDLSFEPRMPVKHVEINDRSGGKILSLAQLLSLAHVQLLDLDSASLQLCGSAQLSITLRLGTTFNNDRVNSLDLPFEPPMQLHIMSLFASNVNETCKVQVF